MRGSKGLKQGRRQRRAAHPAAPPAHPPQAAWLYRATGEEPFLAAAREYLQRAQVGGWVGWGVPGKKPGGAGWRCFRLAGRCRPAASSLQVRAAGALAAPLPPCWPPAVPAQLLCVLGLGVCARRHPAVLPGRGALPRGGPRLADRRLPRHLAEGWVGRGGGAGGTLGAVLGGCCSTAVAENDTYSTPLAHPPSLSLQARTASSSARRAWRSRLWAAGATFATGAVRSRQPPAGQPTACPALQSTLNHSRPAPRPPAAAPTPPS